MLIKLFRTHLAARSAMWLLAIMMLVGLVFLVLARELTAQLEEQRQHRHLEELLDTVASTASIAAFLEDHDLAAEVAIGLLKNHTVSAVRIWSEDALITQQGLTVAEADADVLSRGAITRDISSPFDSDTIVGRIALTPNLDAIEAFTVQAARFISLMLLVLMSAIVLGVFLVVFRQITRPILAISNRLHQLQAEAGEKLNLPKGSETDEIGRLVRDVNALIDNLVNRLREEETLRQNIELEKERFRAIYENASTGIFQVDHRGKLVSCNTAFRNSFKLQDSSETPSATLAELLNISPEAIDAMLDKALEAKHPTSGNFELPSARWFNIILSPLEGTQLQGVANDITESKRSEQAAHNQAITDSLTGLSNRLGFERKLAETIERYRGKTDRHFALLMLDLDHFKPVNDTHGHPAGDQLLKQTSDLLQTCVRKSDFAARLGGDEFALILEGTDDDKIIADIAKKIIEQLHQPIDIGEGIRVQIGASLGIAVFNRHATELKDLVRKSDEALYDAKAAGRKTYRFYGN